MNPVHATSFDSMQQAGWNSTPIYMMDFEGGSTSGVVEFGVVRLLDGAIQSTVTELCAPCGFIGAREQAVHGIVESEVAGRPPFTDFFETFVGFRKDGVFAAHNRHAENNFLKSTWAVPPAVPDWRRGEGHSHEWGPWVDTVPIYKALYPGLESCSLGQLVEAFHIREQLEELARVHCPANRRKAHCALYDALASALLLIRLAEDETLAGHLSLGWLLQFSNGFAPQQELF